MIPNDQIVKCLKDIEDRAWKDQVDMFSPMRDLLALLQVVFCEHEFETKRAGGAPDDPGSNELVGVCKKCGAEQ